MPHPPHSRVSFITCSGEGVSGGLKVVEVPYGFGEVYPTYNVVGDYLVLLNILRANEVLKLLHTIL